MVQYLFVHCDHINNNRYELCSDLCLITAFDDHYLLSPIPVIVVLHETQQILAESLLEVSSEFGVEEEVENRIDARVGGAQPLGQWGHLQQEFTLIVNH